MSNLEIALTGFNDDMKDAFVTIFKSSQEWNSDVWAMIVSINTNLTFFAISLTTLVFYFSMVAKGIRLQDLKRAEVSVSLLIRFAIAIAFVQLSMSILTSLFEIAQGIAAISKSVGFARFNQVAPAEVIEALGNTSDISLEGMQMGLLGLGLMFAFWIIGMVIKLIVWTRFFKLDMHFALAGCFIAFLGSEETQGITISFIKSFLNVCLQAVVVILALLMFSALTRGDNSKAIEMIRAGNEFGGVFEYSKQALFGGLLTLMLIKGGDEVLQRMGL